METPLNLLYTHDIRGELDRLPRMHTLIQRLSKAGPGRVLLIDLGASCVPETWPCDVTEGRASLVALDAMGYTAANTVNVLDAAGRQRLSDQVMMALIAPGFGHIRDDVLLSLDAPPALSDASLMIRMSVAAETALKDGVLYLGAVPRWHVGQLTLTAGQIDLLMAHPVTDAIPPNPTIAGAVEFILDEARYYEKRRASRDQNGAR